MHLAKAFPINRVTHRRILDVPRTVSYSLIGGVWLLVCVYAILHDQYIVSIAEEHFTEYHEPLWGIDHPKLLAAAHAARASIGPGLLLGLACVFVSQSGALPALSVKYVFSCVTCVIVATEIASIASGGVLHFTSWVPYPASWYPDSSEKMLMTQTIQITCYIASALFSGGMLVLLMAVRWRKFKERAASLAP